MGINMRHTIMAIVLICLATISVSCASSPATRESISAQRDDLRRMASNTLSELYALSPGAGKAIKNAAGYAVFSNFGMKILVGGGGKGEGIAINNRDGKETYMNMVEIQAGLGMGIKKFKLVWIFENENDFDRFINSGWELGAQATAAAKIGDDGGGVAGAISVSPGVWLYQIAGDGLALDMTVKGTKYYKDDQLN